MPVVEVPKRKGKKRAKSVLESEASEVEVVQAPEKSGGAILCERCVDRGLRCAWPERKTKQKSCVACTEAKAACRMPRAETKEPRKRRKVEGSEKPARRFGVTKSGDDRVLWADAEIIFGEGFSEVTAAIHEGNQVLRDGLEELQAEGKHMQHLLWMESVQLRGSLEQSYPWTCSCQHVVRSHGLMLRALRVMTLTVSTCDTSARRLSTKSPTGLIGG
jgi:hypothetical protein